MKSLENAVTDTIEELELEEIFEFHIEEIDEGRLYYVTFQEKANGNNEVVLMVEYTPGMGDLLDDDAWEGEVDVEIMSHHGVGQMMAQVIMELLAITIDNDYFDSDSEDEDSDDETETLPSEPSTPMPRALRPLVPRLQVPQRNLP